MCEQSEAADVALSHCYEHDGTFGNVHFCVHLSMQGAGAQLASAAMAKI